MSLIARVLDRAEPIARRKGWKGSSSAWLGVYVISFAYRHLRPRFSAQPVVIREVIEPGQQLVISHYPKGAEPTPPPTLSRRKRKQAAKADAAAAREAEAARKAAAKLAKQEAKRAGRADKAARKALKS